MAVSGSHSTGSVLPKGKDGAQDRIILPWRYSFSTFFGGNGDDSGWGIAIDKSGNPVVAGITDSMDLARTSGSYQHANGGKKGCLSRLVSRPTSSGHSRDLSWRFE